MFGGVESREGIIYCAITTEMGTVIGLLGPMSLIQQLMMVPCPVNEYESSRLQQMKLSTSTEDFIMRGV